MREPVVHIVGAGLGGLAAAAKLASTGASVALHEAAGQGGGRCRSYHEPALDMDIDNGNHLVLSGNHATMEYLDLVDAKSQLVGPAEARFDFVDLTTRERWTLRPNSGPLPWWIFSRDRRVPGTNAFNYLQLGSLLFAKKGTSIGEAISCSGPLYERLWRPLLLAALNTEPPEASAALAASVIRETLALGGSACRPMIAANGLSSAFVDPALRMLQSRGAPIRFGQRLREIGFRDSVVERLDFAEQSIRIDPGDYVILAVPSWVAAGLVPGLEVPTVQSSIINGHFRFDAPDGSPAMLGVIGGAVEWIFAFPGRISITISGADQMLELSREDLAEIFWREIQLALDFEAPMPCWQVIKEKRATFAASPAEDAKRPPSSTSWRNLYLAGDFTASALPATIECAIRSGFRAAELVGAAKRRAIH
jgi:squalene-associated FAD-dependent desaturase